MQLTLDEDTLATIDLGGGEQLAASIGVDAQEVRDLVRPAQWRNDQDGGRPERNGKKDEDSNRVQSDTRPEMGKRAIRLPSTSGDAPVAVRASGTEAASGRMSTSNSLRGYQ